MDPTSPVFLMAEAPRATGALAPPFPANDEHPLVPAPALGRATEAIPSLALRWEEFRAHLDASLSVPIRLADGQTFGWLYIPNSTPHSRTSTQTQLLVEVARLLTVQLEQEETIARERAARAVAEQALGAHNELLATIAHDLRHPLTSLRGRVQLLQRQAARDPTRPADLAGLAIIEAQTGVMSRLIDRLLDTSLLEAGQGLPLLPSKVDLPELVGRVVAAWRATTDRHELVLQAPEQGELIGRWDSGHLEQVLDNVLGNAIKYSPEGGVVTITLTRRETALGPWAVLVVQDEGLGIPAAELPALFERFHRGSNVTGRIPGMGIGLAGTRGIVEQHGGTIGVTSEEGVGSRFTVRLPLC